MKQLSAKCKIAIGVVVLIIVIGAAIAVIKGFNFDIRTRAMQMIQLNIGKEFEKSDIKQITNEVFENEVVLIQKVEVYGDSVAITAKEISDEQKTKMIDKVNEKYGSELKSEDVEIKNVPHKKLKDVIKPFVFPLVLSTLIILVYMGVRFYKIGIIKTLLRVGGIEVLAEAILFAIFAITRFPIGRYTLPLVLFVYLVVLLIMTIKLEKELLDKKESEN